MVTLKTAQELSILMKFPPLECNAFSYLKGAWLLHNSYYKIWLKEAIGSVS